MKEYNFIKRSGFNKKIDAKNVAGRHQVPISPVELKKKNLRKTATKEFESLNLNQVSIDEEDASISSPRSPSASKSHISNLDLNKTMTNI